MSVLKLLLLGGSGVGKTSLINRFSDNKFVDSLPATVGVDFTLKTVVSKGRVTSLHVWDTAGQERFRSLTPASYRSVRGIALVYDVTRLATYNDVREW